MKAFDKSEKIHSMTEVIFVFVILDSDSSDRTVDEVSC